MSLRDRIKVHKKKVYAWVIGFGIVLIGVHNPNQPFLDVAFIPLVGMAVSSFAMLFYLWDNFREIDLGPRKVWIPLAVIVLAMGASGVAQYARGEVSSFQNAISPLVFGLLLFGTYLVARLLKEEIMAPFAVMVIIESISCVWSGLTHIGIRTGGIVGPTNYDMASGYLILGVLFSPKKHQWWLSAVALCGLAFAGAEEAMVGGGILVITLLVRRDWGKKILLPLGVSCIGVVLFFTTSIGDGLYDTAGKRIEELIILVQGGENDHHITQTGVDVDTYPREFVTIEDDDEYLIQYDYEWEETLDNIFWWRWTQYKHAWNNLSWFGNGYKITEFSLYTVHNVPALIVDQIGPFAALAWLFVALYCLIKTRWKYAWIGVLAMSLFDHYLWTQVAPFFWLLIGVSTISDRKDDLIFKDEIY